MSLLWLRVAVLLYGIAALAVLYDRHRWCHTTRLLTLIFHFAKS